MSEFHGKASQAIVSEGLAQGLYVAARARFEPTTLRTKGNESTDEPLCLMYVTMYVCMYLDVAMTYKGLKNKIRKFIHLFCMQGAFNGP